MRCDFSLNRLFQLVANGRCGPLSLVVCMNIQAVKITGFIYVAKTHNDPIINSNYTVMFLK